MATTTKTYEEKDVELEEGAMSFLEHLDELRSRLVRIAMFVGLAFVVCWYFSDKIYNFLEVPVRAAMIVANQGPKTPLDASVGPLTDYVGKEVSYVFVGEAKIGNTPILFMASGFFLTGCSFAYYIAFPRAANFLLGVAAGGNLRPLVTADDYFDLIITIMLGLGVVFEIPTVTFFAARLGLVTPRLLLKVWRYAVVAIFILAAVLSPTTDVPNLLVFAAPMLLLYFLSVGIAWIFHRKRRTEEEYQALER